MQCPLVHSKAYPVENVPPEHFQNQETANGTQGGAVLFAPPSKSCRFSHPPSPCARSMAQEVSLSADSDSEGYSPSKNTSPAALSWSSLTGQLFPNLFAFPRCQTTAKKAEPFLQFDLLLFVFVFRKLIPTRSLNRNLNQFKLSFIACGISITSVVCQIWSI